MSTPQPPSEASAGTPETARLAESGRVEAFSDGVIAIAITLLVLDLKVPTDRPGEVTAGLLHQWPTYLAYLASFAYIGVVWVNHHALFTRIAAVDAGLLWRNLALLLPVSLLPFPTAVLADALQTGTRTDQLGATTLYAVVGAVMASTWLLVFAHLSRRPHLLHGHIGPKFFRTEYRRAVLGIASYTAAGLVALISPSLALVGFVLLPLFYGATSHGWPRRPATEQPTPRNRHPANPPAAGDTPTSKD